MAVTGILGEQLQKRGVGAVLAWVLLLGAAAGYGVADAYDAVPGVLTLQPAPPQPAPIPAWEQVSVDTGQGLLALGVDLADGARAGFAGEAGALAKAQAEAQARLAARPMPSKTKMQAALQEFLQQAPMQGVQAGIEVADVLTGEELLSHDARVPLAPASSLKVMTAVAALHDLGPNMRFTTRTFVQDGVLLLVGGGDNLLSVRRQVEEESAQAQAKAEAKAAAAEVASRAPGTIATPAGSAARVSEASLEELAQRTAFGLQQMGIGTVSVQLDDSLFGQPSLHPDWDGDDVNYVGAVQPLAILAGHRSMEGWGFAPDPALDAANNFVALLKENGITVNGPVTRGKREARAQLVAQVESAPLRKIVQHLVKTSDNTVTEAMCRLVAVGKKDLQAQGAGVTTDVAVATPGEKGVAEAGTATAGAGTKDKAGAGTDNAGTDGAGAVGGLDANFGKSYPISTPGPGFDEATKAVVQASANSGVDTIDTKLRDCSGLSKNNRISAAVLEETVRVGLVSTGPNLGSLSAALPVAAWDGTLRGRYMGKPGAGFLRAKTGSINAVISLTGMYVSAQGRLMTFSVVLNQVPDAQYWPCRDELDKFMNKLAQL